MTAASANNISLVIRKHTLGFWSGLSQTRKSGHTGQRMVVALVLVALVLKAEDFYS